MSARESFLKNDWIPFPPARKDWADVALALREKRSFVCGRIVGREGARAIRLSSGGAEATFELSLETTWLTTKRGDAVFDPEILLEGDLVCVRVEAWSEKSVTADRALLLVPSRARFEPRSRFTIGRSSAWAEYLDVVRAFFKKREFVEALTPTLVPSPGTEPFLDPFATVWEWGSTKRELFLPTSPEFHLKKMLVRGWTKLFEFKTCFRNGEIGSHHQPEFTMLEWYRAYSDLDAIADDVADLVVELQESFFPERAPLRLERTTMAELFAKAFPGFALTPSTTKEELVRLASSAGVRLDPTDTWDEIFHRLFLEKIEEGLGAEKPLLVRGFPPSQAALSRIGQDGFADRFEVYWKGLELANAFHELNDPHENRRRFEDDAAKKAALGKRPVPVDEELLRALDHGLPPSGGIALGLDRLFMSLFGIDEIAETRAFPVTPP